jgi:hypothetical protein
MSLPEKMTEFKKDFEAKVPKEALETMHRATELKKSIIAA